MVFPTGQGVSHAPTMALTSKVSVQVHHYTAHSVISAVVSFYDPRGVLRKSEVVRSAIWERDGETPEEHLARVASAARDLLYESEGLVP